MLVNVNSVNKNESESELQHLIGYKVIIKKADRLKLQLIFHIPVKGLMLYQKCIIWKLSQGFVISVMENICVRDSLLAKETFAMTEATIFSGISAAACCKKVLLWRN